MSRARHTGPLALSGLLLLSACGGGSTPQAAPTLAASPVTAASGPVTPSPSPSPSASPCPAPTGEGDAWPAGVPEQLPKPPGVTLGPVTQQEGGLTIVRFSNPASLRQNVLFVVKQLPAAGFVLGRGDAEAAEADAPFQKGNVRGLMRMVSTQECKTEWLLAYGITTGGQGPAVPSSSASASASPLPFG